ncbi:MAG TPA: hypothetical protein VGW38_11085, partial [Chloroflexota bacterium]|nr:hypothetical protein [Chloroflexota bacterium]
MAISDPSNFARQVHDALLHLHDPVYLRSHRLALQLRHEDPWVTPSRAGKALRQRLLDGMAVLRPAMDTSETSPAWRVYRLLELRYVE